jgi:glucose-6-phosphate 1-dehydrogenase
MTATEKSKKACVLILFGASGDLSFRKILPALYELERSNLLHRDTKIIACDRQQISHAEYIDLIKGKTRQLSNIEINDDVWIKFVNRVQYCSIELNQFEEYFKQIGRAHV